MRCFTLKPCWYMQAKSNCNMYFMHVIYDLNGLCYRHLDLPSSFNQSNFQWVCIWDYIEPATLLMCNCKTTELPDLLHCNLDSPLGWAEDRRCNNTLMGCTEISFWVLLLKLRFCQKKSAMFCPYNDSVLFCFVSFWFIVLTLFFI